MTQTRAVVQTVTGDTLSKVLMITTRRIQQLAADGVFQKEAKGRYALIPCVQAYIKYWQARAVGSDAAPTDLHTERARLTKAQADKTELEVSQLRGDLVHSEVIASTWEAIAANIRAKLLVLPSKTAQVAVAAKDLYEIEESVRVLIYEALNELAENPNYGKGTAADAANVPAAAKANGQPMGRRSAKIKSGVKRGTGTMENG